MIRVAVADDHSLVREGIRRIMANTPDIEVRGEARDGDALRALLLDSSFDVVLLDLNMPGSVGCELIACLAKAHAATPIVVLSFHDEGPVAAQAMQAGATGYVTKGSSSDVLIEAIRKASVGKKHVDPAVVSSWMGDDADQGAAAPEHLLTCRELQILKMIVAGKQLGEIADALYVSPKTVSTHKNNLMRRLGINHNADLIRYAAKHGLGGD